MLVLLDTMVEVEPAGGVEAASTAGTKRIKVLKTFVMVKANDYLVTEYSSVRPFFRRPLYARTFPKKSASGLWIQTTPGRIFEAMKGTGRSFGLDHVGLYTGRSRETNRRLYSSKTSPAPHPRFANSLLRQQWRLSTDDLRSFGRASGD